MVLHKPHWTRHTCPSGAASCRKQLEGTKNRSVLSAADRNTLGRPGRVVGACRFPQAAVSYKLFLVRVLKVSYAVSNSVIDILWRG